MTEGELLRQDFDREIPALAVDELLRLQLDYPYFQAARFLYLKKLQHTFPERYDQALHENVIYAGDRKSLFYRLEGARQAWSRLYPAAEETENKKPDAFDLIDSYLEAHAAEFSTKEPLDGALPAGEIPYRIEELAPAESPVEKDATPEAAKGDSTFGLIDAFLEKSPQEKALPPTPSTEESSPSAVKESEEEPAEDEFLTESLAKIYIKQRRYAKALEIIRKLSLKYPEKNIYFADQIRFLEKLIINIKTE